MTSTSKSIFETRVKNFIPFFVVVKLTVFTGFLIYMMQGQQFLRSIRKTNSRLALPGPNLTLINSFLIIFQRNYLYISLKKFPQKNKLTAATYKKTALKVLVLWNLPALLLLAGAFQIGSSVIVQLQVKEMDMNTFKPIFQHLGEFYGKVLSINFPINKFYPKILLTKATT